VLIPTEKIPFLRDERIQQKALAAPRDARKHLSDQQRCGFSLREKPFLWLVLVVEQK